MLSIWVDILTFASVLLLAAPAFQINRYARRAARLSSLRFEPGFSSLSDVYKKAKKALENARDGWTPGKARLLFWGTITAALAALLSLIDHLHTYLGKVPVPPGSH